MPQLRSSNLKQAEPYLFPDSKAFNGCLLSPWHSLVFKAFSQTHTY